MTSARELGILAGIVTKTALSTYPAATAASAIPDRFAGQIGLERGVEELGSD
jgi:hypothetical protein